MLTPCDRTTSWRWTLFTSGRCCSTGRFTAGCVLHVRQRWVSARHRARHPASSLWTFGISQHSAMDHKSSGCRRCRVYAPCCRLSCRKWARGDWGGRWPWYGGWCHSFGRPAWWLWRCSGVYFNGLARKDANIAAKNLVRLEMTRPSVPSTHWKMKWGIKECSFQCFRLIGFMHFFLRINCPYRSFLKCSGFSIFLKNMLVRVRHTMQDQILEHKNGIASNYFGSKTPL